MSEFDSRAQDWDKNQMHIDRAEAIASAMLDMVPITHKMTALEYGAGTGLLSFCLKDRFADITLMDSSQEMVRVTQGKIADQKIEHMRVIWFDLEHTDYDHKFDMVFNQMVLHHVNDVDVILKKFYSLLTPGGYLAIADLYAEDGSFHGPDVKVHWGFDPAKLAKSLKSMGFNNTEYKTCYSVTKDSGKSYPIFLLVAQK